MKKKKLRKIALWLMILSIISFPLIGLIAILLKDFPTAVNIHTILLFIAVDGGFFGAIVLFIVSLFIGNEKKAVLQNECGNDTKKEKESHREPKYTSGGVISDNEIQIGAYMNTGEDYCIEIIKKIAGKWMVCSHSMNPCKCGGYVEYELDREYFEIHNIQNVDDLLKDILKGELKPCIEIIKNNRKTVETIDNIFRDLYYSEESNTEDSPGNN